MQFDFLQFIDTNFLKIITLIIMLVCVIIEFVSTGSIKKSLKIYKEVSNMTFTQAQKKNAEIKGQEYSEIIDDLKYNPDTQIVEKVGEKNAQDIVQSSLSSSLDVFLQRFSNDVVDEQETPLAVSMSNNETAYDAMINAAIVAEDYAKEHNLKNASFIDIMKAINEEHKQTNINTNIVKEEKENNEKDKIVKEEEQA